MKIRNVSYLMICLIVICIGCQPRTQEPQRIQVGKEYHIETKLPQMVQQSELIVIGRFGSQTESFNADRNPHNPKQESTESYSETLVYDFEITQTLKGKSDASTIPVGIPYTTNVNGITDQQGNPLKVSIIDPLHVQPTSEKTYLLFLYKDRNVNTYLAPFFPNIVKIDANQNTIVQKSAPHQEKSFMSKTTNQRYHLSIEGVELTEEPFTGKKIGTIKQQIKANQP